MAFTDIKAYNFGRDWDGIYSMIDTYVWSNGTYFLYTNGFYWMISESQYFFDPVNLDFSTVPGHLKAQKEYVATSTPAGTYVGVDSNPSGTVILFSS